MSSNKRIYINFRCSSCGCNVTRKSEEVFGRDCSEGLQSEEKIKAALDNTWKLYDFWKGSDQFVHHCAARSTGRLKPTSIFYK